MSLQQLNSEIESLRSQLRAVLESVSAKEEQHTALTKAIAAEKNQTRNLDQQIYELRSQLQKVETEHAFSGEIRELRPLSDRINRLSAELFGLVTEFCDRASSLLQQQKSPELDSNLRAEFDLRLKPETLPVVLQQPGDNKFLLLPRELAAYRKKTSPVFPYDLDSVLQPQPPEKSGEPEKG